MTEAHASNKIHSTESFSWAVDVGDVDYLRAAISKGVNPRKEDPSAVLMLAFRGNEEGLRLLLDNWGADSHEKSLEAAAKNGHAGCVEALIPHCNPEQSRALRFAAQEGWPECVRLLASVGNVREEPTPLFMAAHGGHAECAELLIPFSDLLAKDMHGFTAAGQARDRGHADVAAMIESAIEAQVLASLIPAGEKLAKRRIDRVADGASSDKRPVAK